MIALPSTKSTIIPPFNRIGAEGPWCRARGASMLEAPKEATMAEPTDGVEMLDERECWELLEQAPLGRIALAAAGEVDIFPINFAVHDGALWFRTAPGTKLLELTVHPRVALEIDGWDDEKAYSVVVKGVAERLEHGSEI